MNSIRRILVAIDGSETSLRAIDFSIGLAKYTSADLVFLHSVDITGITSACADPYALIDVGPLLESLESQCRIALHDAGDRARARGIIATKLETAGPPTDAILDAVHDQNIDVVVMGTHGRSAAENFFLGSVADGVLRRTDVPVFAIPAAGENLHVDGSAFRLIEVAFDASEPAAAALRLALQIAEPGKTNLLLAHALVADRPEALLDEQQSARTSIAEAAKRAADAGITVETMLLDGPPAQRVSDIARSHGADLIAIGTHGRRGIERLLLGSVAAGVLRSASIPVLVVPGARAAKSPASVPKVVAVVAR